LTTENEDCSVDDILNSLANDYDDGCHLFSWNVWWSVGETCFSANTFIHRHTWSIERKVHAHTHPNR
jgi:hypothetical protein